MGSLLHVAFQEGFEGDAVVLRLGGEEVYRRDALATRTQIGLADTFELVVDDGDVELEVSLPGRSLEQAMTLTVAGPTYVGVSLERGALALRTQHEPFGYV